MSSPFVPSSNREKVIAMLLPGLGIFTVYLLFHVFFHGNVARMERELIAAEEFSKSPNQILAAESQYKASQNTSQEMRELVATTKDLIDHECANFGDERIRLVAVQHFSVLAKLHGLRLMSQEISEKPALMEQAKEAIEIIQEKNNQTGTFREFNLVGSFNAMGKLLERCAADKTFHGVPVQIHMEEARGSNTEWRIIFFM